MHENIGESLKKMHQIRAVIKKALPSEGTCLHIDTLTTRKIPGRISINNFYQSERTFWEKGHFGNNTG